MFCTKCGNRVENGASFCPHCGNNLGGGNNQQVVYYVQNQSNGFAVAGFVLSFLFPLLGLIFSIIGCSKAKYLNNNGKGLSVAGIIISTIFMATSLILSIVLLS